MGENVSSNSRTALQHNMIDLARQKKSPEMPGVESGAFHMQSERSTHGLIPLQAKRLKISFAHNHLYTTYNQPPKQHNVNYFKLKP